MDIYATSLTLLDLGISFIPVGRNKRPLLKWEEFQHRLPTKPEAYTWFKRNSYQIAIVCGKISGGLTVLDFDDLSDEYLLKWCEQPYTYTMVGILPFVQTGNGTHVYFRSALEIGNKKLARKEENGKILNLIETRGEGGYAICPPSLHPSGKRYQFIGDLTFTDIPQLSEKEAKRLIETAEMFNEIEEKNQKRIVFSRNQKIDDSDKRKYALGTLKGIASDLSDIGQGDRNNRLYKASFRLGRWMGAGLLRDYEIEEEIRFACNQNGLIRDDGEHSFFATLKSGISDGHSTPITSAEIEEKLSNDAWIVNFSNKRKLQEEQNGDGEKGWLTPKIRKMMTED